MEKHGIEGYGMGTSLQRAEYYRSFGWLMPQDVSKVYHTYMMVPVRTFSSMKEMSLAGTPH